MIKRPKNDNLRYGWGDYVYTNAKIVYTNANKYDHFEIDAPKLGSSSGFISLSKHPYIHKPKWEISMRFYVFEHSEYVGHAFTLRKDVTIDYGLRYEGANSADTGTVWNKGNKERLKLTVTDGAIELISLSSGKIFFKYEDSTIRKSELKYLLVAADGEEKNSEWIIKGKINHTRVTTASTTTPTTIPTTTPTTAPDEEITVTITTTTTTPKTTQSTSPSSDRKFQPFIYKKVFY